MQHKVRNIIVILSLFSWPLNLFLANTPGDFLKYLIPLVLLSLSYYLHRKKADYFYAPTLLIPFFEPKLAIFPILFVLHRFYFSKNKRISYYPLILSILVFSSVWPSFKEQSIFTYDYQARQEILREINLYPNPLLARIFQNKARVYTDKFVDNLFALTDPNNYFFAFHPREISVTNQNLDKYPFLSIFLFLIGIIYFAKNKDKQFIVSAFISGVVSLSLLSSYDRHDFILWLPISLVLIAGTNSALLRKNKYFYVYSVLLIASFLIQFLRNYLIYLE